ncbi:type II toxin-antitoxin system PemK/MazF family toxin [candidate division WOR-3 bacterium]|nr:type II toxin-antitoxin system PemK/MazF family toxin [candidate division WOR-3 bacterium]
MEGFVRGEVVVIPFPFSDLTNSKKRPALIVSRLKGDDVILCQITSKTIKDDYAIEILDSDFNKGSLNQPSNIRPNKLFTADKKIIRRSVGNLNDKKFDKVIEKIVQIIENKI